MSTLGRQSRPHREAARKWLDRASVSASKARARCDVAFPAIVRAHEALSLAWAHIDSIGETAPRDVRAKRQLQDAHRAIAKKATRAFDAFTDRCIIKR